MSWNDRGADADRGGTFGGGGGRDGAGGDWRGVRPRFDDPMSWSLPLARLAGVTIRVHLFFIVFVAIELLRAIFAAPTADGAIALGMRPTLLLLVCLFWSVLVHEFGHVFACRAAAGEADEVLLWPLGGLATCRPAPNWLAHLATHAGGPLANLAIIAVAGPTLGVLANRWAGVAFPSPLSLYTAHGGLAVVESSWGLTALFMLVWTNVVLLVFNLLPIHPFDGGRILQSLLWPPLGYAPATRISVRIGYLGAIALAVFGFVRNETILLAVAVFGGIVCWQTMKRLEYTQQVLGFEPGPEGELQPAPDPDETRRARDEARRREAAEQLDRILQKIAESGIDSLSARERRLLRDATEHRRRERGGGEIGGT
ncbi:MAG: site-2 protease family protein [Phycisphaerales bacterium]